MKIQVTAKAEEVDKPIRGFIETPDIKLTFFTNSQKQITRIDLTLGKKTTTYKDAHVFILWSDVELAIDSYLQSKAPKKKEVVTTPLVNTTRKGVTKKKTNGKR